jgi:hypothetical protein
MPDERKVRIDTGADLHPETRAMLEETTEEETLHDDADSSLKKPGMGVGMPLPTPPIPENNDRAREEKDEAQDG